MLLYTKNPHTLQGALNRLCTEPALAVSMVFLHRNGTTKMKM